MTIDEESVEAVRVLVEHGADIHAKTTNDMTAMQYAMKWCTSRDSIVGYLIGQDAQDAASAELSSWTIV